MMLLLAICDKLCLTSQLFVEAMATAEKCDYGPGKDSYVADYLIMLPLITLLQIILFIHSSYYGKRLKKTKNGIILQVVFILIQIAAIIYHISAEIKGIASKYYTHWFNGRLFCNYTRFVYRYNCNILYAYVYLKHL